MSNGQPPHVTLSEEAYRRLKLFSAKYGLPMKRVVEWFIYSIIDEDGDPQLSYVEETLMEKMPEKLKKTIGD